MAGFPQHAWQHGRLIPFADAKIGLGDRGLLFGESLYEVLPLTCNKSRLVQPHVARMRRGAAAIGLVNADIDRLVDETSWTHIAGALLRAEGIRDGLLYLQLTGGAGPRAHLGEATPELFAYAMPHVYPDRDRVAHGVRVVTAEDPRWARCDLKTTMLLAAVLGKRRARERGADEMLWIGADESVREGASSNIGIVEHGAVIVPPPGPHLLPGITIATLAASAPQLGIPWRAEPIDRQRLATADEVFIAATSQLVMPVLAIDDVPVGDGIAGPVATRLAEAMRALLELD